MKKLLLMAVASLMILSSCEKEPIEPNVDTVLVGTLTENIKFGHLKVMCMYLKVLH